MKYEGTDSENNQEVARKNPRNLIIYTRTFLALKYLFGLPIVKAEKCAAFLARSVHSHDRYVLWQYVMPSLVHPLLAWYLLVDHGKCIWVDAFIDAVNVRTVLC